MYSVNQFLIRETELLLEALRRMSELGSTFLVVVDEKKHLLGTLTDGDVRRHLVSGFPINVKVNELYQRAPEFFRIGEFSRVDVKNAFEVRRRKVVPVVDSKQIVIDVLKDSEEGCRSKFLGSVDAPVVIMAGGKGLRWRPVTNFMPKPLIPIGDKPIIATLFDWFENWGCPKFYVSVNYKKDMIKEYLNKSYPDLDIEYLEEDCELGTAGSLSLIDSLGVGSELIVANADNFFDFSLDQLLVRHKERQAEITTVLAWETVELPYGVCEVSNEGQVTNIVEKPSHRYLVNTGMYVISAKALELIEPETKLDFPELITRTLGRSGKVSSLVIESHQWLDVGQREFVESVEKKLNF